MHILTLSHFLAEVFHNKVTTSLFGGFKQKENFFNVTLIINTFLSKSIKKHYTNHIRQLCIGKNRLISVKYCLNSTKVEN